MTIDELITHTIQEAVNKSLTVKRAEEIAFSRFENVQISVEVAAAILQRHPDSVRSLIKFGELSALPRANNKSPFKLILSDVLAHKTPKHQRIK